MEATDLTLGFMANMLRSLSQEEQEIFMVLFQKIARAARSGAQALVASPTEGQVN
jgi:hypothetical protein